MPPVGTHTGALEGSTSTGGGVGGGGGRCPPVAESAAITGLSPNTEYHFRIVAINVSGTSHGADVTYQLGAYPVITQYGYTDTPGRWDHWPSGFLFTGGRDDGVDGKVVIAPGDRKRKWTEDDEASSIFRYASEKADGLRLLPCYAVSDSTADTIVDIAATVGASHLIVGAPQRSALLNLLRGNIITNISTILPEEIHFLVYA